MWNPISPLPIPAPRAIHGAAAFERICRAVPLYAPLRLLLLLPTVRRKVETEMNGDCGGACEVR